MPQRPTVNRAAPIRRPQGEPSPRSQGQSPLRESSERHANYVDVDAYLRTIAQVKAQVQDGVGCPWPPSLVEGPWVRYCDTARSPTDDPAEIYCRGDWCCERHRARGRHSSPSTGPKLSLSTNAVQLQAATSRIVATRSHRLRPRRSGSAGTTSLVSSPRRGENRSMVVCNAGVIAPGDPLTSTRPPSTFSSTSCCEVSSTTRAVTAAVPRTGSRAPVRNRVDGWYHRASHLCDVLQYLRPDRRAFAAVNARSTRRTCT